MHGDLERVCGGVRRALAPERVDEALTRDHLVGAEEEQRQERPLAPPGERHRFAVPQDLEGSENPERVRNPWPVHASPASPQRAVSEW